ncbi:MAG: twin-arginine translocation pathway signal protein [Pseudomonadota bacterium]
MPTRRVLLTGAASIVIIGGIAGGTALHSDLRIARAPWRLAGTEYDDPRLNALAYGVLAPSPHNRQPWLVDLKEENAAVLYCDLDRRLPETDPYDRQITIGLGAFLELLRMAGAEQGYRIAVTPFPDGEPSPRLNEKPVARIQFIRDETVAPDPLFAFVMDRRTNRNPFDQTQTVSEGAMQRLDAVLRADDGYFEWETAQDNVQSLKGLCRKSWEVETTTGRTHGESVRLTRIGEREINANPDGISLSGPLMEGMRLAGVLSRDKMADKNSTMFAESLAFYSGLIDSAMAFGWLSTDDNSRKSQLNAGAGWLRLHLAATATGLALQPLSQILQEFPEMTDLYNEFHEFVGLKAPARVQGLFRFGYAKAPPPAPRWPLETRIIEA